MTEGKPKVFTIVAAKVFDENDVLRLTASVERRSEYPLGVAIVAEVTARKIDLSRASQFDS